MAEYTVAEYVQRTWLAETAAAAAAGAMSALVAELAHTHGRTVRVVEVGHLEALTEALTGQIQSLADRGLVDYLVTDTDPKAPAALPSWVKFCPLNPSGALDRRIILHSADLVVLGAATWRHPDADKYLQAAKCLLAPGMLYIPYCRRGHKALFRLVVA
jgi:hypothetical protein